MEIFIKVEESETLSQSSAHVVSFEKMRGLIDSKHSDAELIMEIQKYSHLVQGVWVLKRYR